MNLKTFAITKKILGDFAGFSLNEDKTLLATIPEDISEDINIYETDNWKFIKTLNGISEQDKYLGYIDYCRSICFSPNNKYLVATYFQKIKIFNIETGEVIYRAFCSSWNSNFSEDGKYICFNDGEGLKLFEFGFEWNIWKVGNMEYTYDTWTTGNPDLIQSYRYTGTKPNYTITNYSTEDTKT